MRQAAHVRLRTAVYHWAASPYSTTKEAGSNTPLFGAKATVMPAPLRSVADRVLAVACAMLQPNRFQSKSRRQRSQNCQLRAP
jgi:hypothetical protein